MSSKLTKELQEQIKKHLPEMVSGELMERLKEGEAAIKSVPSLEAEIEAGAKEVKRLTAELKSLEKTIEAFKQREAEIAHREKVASDREAAVAIKEGEAASMLDYATRSKEDIFRLVETIFKNPVVRQTVHGHQPVAMPGMPANSQYPGSSATMPYTAAAPHSSEIITTES